MFIEVLEKHANIEANQLKFRMALALSTLITVGTVTYASEPTSASKVIETMELELKRSMAKLKNAGAAPVYFIAYRLYESAEGENISASEGALEEEKPQQAWRMLAVELRVGSPQLDNTHYLRREGSHPAAVYDRSTKRDSILPARGGDLPLRQALWLKTDEAFKNAQQRFLSVKASHEVLAEEEDKSGDFVAQSAQHHIAESSDKENIDSSEWEARIKTLSKLFSNHSNLEHSSVRFFSHPTRRYIVDSEGTKLLENHLSRGVSIRASTRTEDGMHLQLSDTVMDADLAKLRDEAMLTKRVEKLADTLDALRDAPPAESYVGPAILSGRASAVFFHETLGHRVEAVHEKSEVEGKTFAKKIGSQVMPSFITVIDDPTAADAYGESLNGHYKYDDEGVVAQPVTIVKKGILTGFLLGRTPLQGFEKSNGHGRSAPGWNPMARQANLFVQTAPNKQLDPAALRALLIKEAKRQKKPYGLYFEDISGGSTGTHQSSHQSYNIYPRVVYKVFVDGRKDQLIRGAGIVGTPLSALEKIIASGNDYSVFNGSCGRESGFIPVSAVAPSLLVQSIEIKRTAKTFQKPPILPDPNQATSEKKQEVSQ